ncbi:MAG: hypothetical protein AAF218_09675 [Pseudomonadota bacterium]
MSGKISPPVFLERRSYRRRRMLDALRLMPVLGLGLFMLPLFWPASSVETGAAVPLSTAITYVFAAWLLLIALAAALWLMLRRSEPER